MRKRFTSALTAAAVMVVAAGCTAGEDETPAAAADRPAIGLAMPTKEFERWIADGENMVEQFQLLGYDTDLRYADDDVDLQIEQIGEMVDNKVDALVVGAIDGTALKGVLAKAAAADITIISYDRLIRDTGDISYYATFDNYKVGVQQGNTIVEALRLADRKGPFTLELFAGSPDDNNATFFFNGAMSVLQPYLKSGQLVVRSGETKLSEVGTMRWDPETAAARMTKLLRSDYDGKRLDAVLSPNDGIARGVLGALEAAGYGSKSRPLPVLTGQDAELESAKLIAAGKQTSTIYKDTRELAKVAVQMVDAVLDGDEPFINDTEQYHNGVEAVPTFLLQPVSVDKSNYKRVLVDGGYYTASELAS